MSATPDAGTQERRDAGTPSPRPQLERISPAPRPRKTRIAQPPPPELRSLAHPDWPDPIRALLGGCLALVLGVCLPACNALQPNALPRELSDAARQISTSIADQAVWTRVLARLNGQVITPGMEAYVRTEYAAGVRMPGVSGQLQIEGDGAGSGPLSGAARSVILALAQRQPDLLDVIVDLLRAERASAADIAAVRAAAGTTFSNPSAGGADSSATADTTTPPTPPGAP